MDSTSPSQPRPLIAIQLEGGDWLSLYPTYVAIGQQSIWLVDLVGSGIDVAPSASPPGAVATILLGVRSGHRYTLTPAHPEQAAQFLDALYSIRPDLRPPTQPLTGGQPGAARSPITQPLIRNAMAKAQEGLRAAKPLAQKAKDKAQEGLRAAKPAVDGAVAKAQEGLHAAKPVVDGAIAKAQEGLHAARPAVDGAVAKAQEGLHAVKPMALNALDNAREGAKAGLAKLPDVQIQIITPSQSENQVSPVQDAEVVDGQLVEVPADRRVARVKVALKPRRTKPPRKPRINSTKLLAGFSHLTGLLPLMVVPLILWQTLQNRKPFVANHAKQAFFFQVIAFVPLAILSAAFLAVAAVYYAKVHDDLISFISSIIAAAVLKILNPNAPPPPIDPTTDIHLTIASAVLLFVLFLMWTFISTFTLLSITLASIRGFQGKAFHYPFLGRLWKKV